jgi:hypothetical protein
LDGENPFTSDEIPLKALRKSVCSAGSTDADALYHLGANKAYIVALAVIININKNKNHLNLTTTTMKSISEDPVLLLPVGTFSKGCLVSI